jgi:predicted nuclease of predicted toxin-antitoxin system
MKFFFDQNLSPHIVKGMSAFGEDAIHLTDKFPADTEDAKWLKFVGQNKLILITRDLRIRYRPAEISAFRRYKVGAFVLAGKNRSKCQLIQQIVRIWPRIKELDQKTNRPYAFRIPPKGTSITSISLY